MSLRAFHVVFIVLAAAVLFGFGWWGLAGGGMVGWAVASGLCGVAVVIYAIVYFRKLFRLKDRS